MNGETILILANAEWDWTNRVNCHHIAERLAQHNRVLFVDTVGGRTPAPREFKKIVRRLRRIAGGIRQINDGLTVLAPFVIPVYGSDVIRRLNTTLLAWQMRRAMPQGSTAPILWLYLPSLVGLVGHFGEKLVVYHCVDFHAANPNVPARQVNEWEQQLLRQADVVLTTSLPLYEDKRQYNAHTFYLPNVADTAHFAKARDAALPMAADMRDIPHPIAGYVGNISAYKMDIDLVCTVARQRPDWSFVLIGPIGRGDPSTDASRFQGLKNIFLLGARSYGDLPGYVKAFDACIIPFNQNESTRGSLPMKFFEYMATGKPVIATDLPTLQEFKEFFYPVHDAREFSDALQAARCEDAAYAARRIDISKRYSWDGRMIELDKIVEDASRGRLERPVEPGKSVERLLKRLIDIVVSGVLLILLSPVLLVIALATVISSGTPILYEWNVVGKDGRPFKGFKFRTMVQNADELKETLLHRNEMNGGPVFKLKDDPRITPVGRVLRKFSLDELPQLWSVFKGDMSLVGPRPPLVYEYAKFTEQQKFKLAVKPGMTSLWQVSGKPSDFAEWLRLDFEYIERWSLWLDLQILVKTAFVVLRGKNY